MVADYFLRLPLLPPLFLEVFDAAAFAFFAAMNLASPPLSLPIISLLGLRKDAPRVSLGYSASPR